VRARSVSTRVGSINDQRRRPHPRRRPEGVRVPRRRRERPALAVRRQRDPATGPKLPAGTRHHQRVTNPWAARSAPTSRSPRSNRTCTRWPG